MGRWGPLERGEEKEGGRKGPKGGRMWGFENFHYVDGDWTIKIMSH